MSNLTIGSKSSDGGSKLNNGDIPRKCWCGNPIVMRKSKTARNPNRWFYRCELAATRKLEKDSHTFLWVDEVGNEAPVEMMLFRLEEEVKELKKTVTGQIKKMDMEIEERIQFAVAEAKAESRKTMVGVVLCCALSVLMSKYFVGVSN